MIDFDFKSPKNDLVMIYTWYWDIHVQNADSPWVHTEPMITLCHDSLPNINYVIRKREKLSDVTLKLDG